MAKRQKTDLKRAKTKWANGTTDHSTQSESCPVRVVLRGITNALEALIDSRSNGYILCACAWITSLPLIKALLRAKRRGLTVLLIVQKETWLQRPRTKFHRMLANEYRSLGSYADLPLMGAACLQQVEAVRCVGKVTRAESARMHHKFLVFGNQEPESVWTGSFNLSATAEDSFENAVVIDDPTCAAAYFQEFRTLLLLSEPITSTSKTMRPSWQ